MAIKVELLILLILGISACATSNGCPRKEDMPQCECVDGINSGIWLLNCGLRGTTIQEYVQVFQDNNITANKEMWISFERLADYSTIPSRVFEGFDIKELDIYFSEHILSWADEEGGPAFVGLEDSLEVFRAFRSINFPRGYYYLPVDEAPMSLGHLRKLRQVEFTYNEMLVFGSGFFENGPSSLEILWIRYCSVRYFGDRAFAGLSNLKEIVVKHNDFKRMDRGMFPNPANHLEKMDLGFNDLQHLSDDFFTNMPALTHVILHGNSITRLPEHTWRPVWSQLTELDLFYIDLNCDDDNIRWMFSLKPPKKMWATCQKPRHMYGVDLRKHIKRQRKALKNKKMN